jgi:ring-1,2-phenylacetyl-CoA epoxidase subunit PaaD
VDLGIIRDVQVSVNDANDKIAAITITPTYTGCPAMDMIRMQIRMQLLHEGFHTVHITQQLSPAWTTDWISEKGKAQLQAYGIAPPHPKPREVKGFFSEKENVTCPHCGSHNTVMLSEFGSTACKSLYKCLDCQEPFDYFKCH